VAVFCCLLERQGKKPLSRSDVGSTSSAGSAAERAKRGPQGEAHGWAE
jgi:hypothetical protein